MMTDMFSTILDGLISSLNDGSAEGGASAMAETLLSIVSAAIDSVVTMATTLAPKLWELATTLIGQLFEGIVNSAPTLGGSASSVISEFLAGVQSNLPTLLSQGVEFITNIVNGILEALPTLIASAGEVITAFVGGILPMLPTIIENGVHLVLNLIDGILSALPDVLVAVGELVLALIGELYNNAPQLLETGITLIGEVIAGLIKGLVKLGSAVSEFEKQFRKKIKDIDWKKIGTEVITAIIKGLKEGGSAIGGALKDLFVGALKGDNEKGGGGSKTPSSAGKGAGNSFVMGMANAISGGAPIIQDAIKSITDGGNNSRVIASVEQTSRVNYGGSAMSNTFGALERRIDALSESLETYSRVVASGRNVNVTLQGDAKTMFKAIQRENNVYRTSTGRSVFA